ncbi:hypothetical protein D7D52_27350 [Nocardia yunnanensis]|uniref:Uncharacterized protein n=1 Tax=Nocardia yunnanensis TaxID=2382165 RepID=A0A386ZJY5_9NOCA|nr:hypothetical protein [Nocardia yunnanensis]AYF76905.1 hypothetical protein D7D52_27350 [Nocardia yunnanensis]
MLISLANGNESRISLWQRVREYAVPPSMIEAATARRMVGDWAGACAAAGFDVDIDLRVLARRYGRDLTARIRADLRHLAPDLLRWHMPRIAPDGLLRPGLTITLAQYGAESPCASGGSVHLIVRTAPAWAEAGQRISLSVWDARDAGSGVRLHPHGRPDRRFRLDLHRHLWDARRSSELRMRSGAACLADHSGLDPGITDLAPPGCALGRWTAEAAILLRANGTPSSPLLVRCGRQRLIVEPSPGGDDPPMLRLAVGYPRGRVGALPVLPDTATWTLPDLELLEAGAITAERLHPLVAAALVPGYQRRDSRCGTESSDAVRLVDCRGERHRIGLVDGVLTALDHDPAEIRREELLVALTGSPLPCLRAIDLAHRQPDCLAGVRERLRHGDTAGALAIVEDLLGPGAALRDGALRDALETAAQRRIDYGLFRSGLSAHAMPAADKTRPKRGVPVPRTHPRHASTR